MSIRQMIKCEIVCDGCKKVVARLDASKQVYDALNADAGRDMSEGERFAGIECAACIVASVSPSLLGEGKTE